MAILQKNTVNISCFNLLKHNSFAPPYGDRSQDIMLLRILSAFLRHHATMTVKICFLRQILTKFQAAKRAKYYAWETCIHNCPVLSYNWSSVQDSTNTGDVNTRAPRGVRNGKRIRSEFSI